MRIYKVLVFELLRMVLPVHIAIADANGEQTRPGSPWHALRHQSYRVTGS